MPEMVRPDLYTRMLCSCLADGDRLDSAGRAPLDASLEVDARPGLLLRHLEGLAARAPEGVVKEMRAPAAAPTFNYAWDRLGGAPGLVGWLWFPTRN